MPELELTANNPTFTPVPLDANDQVLGERGNGLLNRVTAAMAEADRASRNLLNTDYRNWDRDTHKASLRQARRDAIDKWNKEQLVKANT